MGVSAGWDVVGHGGAVGVAAAAGMDMGSSKGRTDWGWAEAGPTGSVDDMGHGKEKIIWLSVGIG